MRKCHGGQASTSHDLATDALGRTTKYVYDNPDTGRAVVVLNCSHQLDQEFADGDAEVRASLDFEPAGEGQNPVMKLSIVVMMRKNAAGIGAKQQKA